MENQGDLFVPYEEVVLIVIDFQEKLLPAVKNSEEIVNNAKKAGLIANTLGVPVILTEQVPDKIGTTVNEIKDNVKFEGIISKKDFSCFGETAFVKTIEETGAASIIICGIESHVCVMQTALDALASDYDVYILADAVGSRKDIDKEIALKRASEMGAEIITTEMMAFEMMINAEHSDFKTISKIVK